MNDGRDITEGIAGKNRRKLIKICGMTTEEDIAYANEYRPDLVGFVLFFPKSKRNQTIQEATRLRTRLAKEIKSVAVVVSPTVEQAKQIEENGFDYIQIHGKMGQEVYDSLCLPILRAFNVSDMKAFDRLRGLDKIAGYVFDSKNPGSGKTFDWLLLDQIERDGKLLLLAGGIDENNVREAIRQVNPDGIDVSSAVERVNGPGKDPEKMKNIIRMVHDEK